MLELGKGFMYVGSQQRVTLGNTHYYVDMVFYNKILRSYVLIELKTGKLMPEAVGQLNMYLNYYKAEVNDEMDMNLLELSFVLIKTVYRQNMHLAVYPIRYLLLSIRYIFRIENN